MYLADVQRLRALTLVLDLGSVSAAAEVLGYTQSAVSQQLAALEREVGTPLVDRAQRPLRPTPAGAELRPHAERVLAEVHRAQAVAEALRRGTPRLRLAAFNSALSSFVPAAVRDLRRLHPDLVVEVHPHEASEAIELLRAGEVDLAVVHHIMGAATPDSGGLQSTRLPDDDLYVVVPEGHRLARRDAVPLADLDGEPLVLPRRGSAAGHYRSFVERLCAQAGFTPTVAYEIEDLPAAQAFAAAGIAVVPMHGLTLATLPRGATARPLAERPAGSRTVEVLVLEHAPPPAENLVARLVTAAAGYGSRSRSAFSGLAASGP